MSNFVYPIVNVDVLRNRFVTTIRVVQHTQPEESNRQNIKTL